MKFFKTALSLALTVALAASVMMVAFAADVVVTVTSDLNKDTITIGEDASAVDYEAGKLIVNTVTVPKDSSIGALVLNFEYDETLYELVGITPDQDGRIIEIINGVAWYQGDPDAPIVGVDDEVEYVLEIGAETESGKIIFGYVATDLLPVSEGKSEQVLLTFLLKSITDDTIAGDALEGVITGSIATGNNPKDLTGANFGVTFVYKGGRLPGDADDNGKVNATDATMILRNLFWTGTKKPTINESNADVDDNGKVNATDATTILRHLFWTGAKQPPLL
jgi:hypothetical protein